MTARSRSAPADAGGMSIGALARATGIAVETLRTWERRYGVPAPTRKPSGHRLYPASAVDHLRRVAMLLNRGHRPADLFALSHADLDGLLAVSDARPAPGIATAVPAPATTSRLAAAATAPAGTGPGVPGLLELARAMARERLLAELRSCWSRLGPLRFLEEVAGPLMVAVGEAWEAGELGVRQEHFASACLSDFLREARAPYDDRASGPRIAAATLDGDLHEGGLLMAAVLMAVRGWRVVYLGPNTPAGELAEMARTAPIDVVAVSISPSTARPRAAKTLRTLRGKLPRRVALWVGGAGAPGASRGIEHFASLTALDARLALSA